jgi:hypothetical protein
MLSMGTRVGLSALTATVLALGAAACGSSSSSSSGGGSAQSASSSAAPAATSSSAAAATASNVAATTSSAAATTSGAAASPGGATAAPGTSLKTGASASVPFATTLKSGKDGPSYKLTVQVQSMTKGTLADFNGIQLDATEKASTPFYVKAKITNLGPGKINTSDNDPGIQIEGVDKTGQTQQSVTFLGDFPKCDEKSAPNPMGVGSSFETCLTFLVPGGITKVAYTGTESYIDKPVTWSP